MYKGVSILENNNIQGKVLKIKNFDLKVYNL